MIILAFIFTYIVIFTSVFYYFLKHILTLPSLYYILVFINMFYNLLDYLKD